jgi:hypothetical protein
MSSLDRWRSSAYRLYRLGVLVLATPVVLAEYFHPDTGAAYDVGLVSKLLVAGTMVRKTDASPPVRPSSNTSSSRRSSCYSARRRGPRRRVRLLQGWKHSEPLARRDAL